MTTTENSPTNIHTEVPEGATIHTEVPGGAAPLVGEEYYSPDFARTEWEAMWTRTWQVAGRREQMIDPGDYITHQFGRESILCVLGPDERVRAFYNVCQHRGNQLVAAEEGSVVNEFECAYHGWRFDTCGILKHVSSEQDFAGGSLCGKRNLVEIPCEEWGGFIWFNMDPEAKPLASYLGPVADALAPYHMERMRRTHWVTYEANMNWKVIQDNFNETYHVPFVHPQLDGAMEVHYEGWHLEYFPPYGHSLAIIPSGGPGPQYEGTAERVLKSLRNDLEFWGIDPEDFRHNLQGFRGELQKKKRELGASKGYDFSRYTDAQLTDQFHYAIFPNTTMSMKPDGCLLMRPSPHPDDPEKCIFDMWYMTLFPEGAEEYYSNWMRERVSVDDRPSHVVGKAGEVDAGRELDQDLAVWTTQQLGLRSRGYRGAVLARQEGRVQYFHNTLRRYIDAYHANAVP